MYKSNNRKTRKTSKPQDKAKKVILKVDANDPKYDPVVIDEIPDGRVECKDCAGFSYNPYRGKCKVGEIQYFNMKINCDKFYQSKPNGEIEWV